MLTKGDVRCMPHNNINRAKQGKYEYQNPMEGKKVVFVEDDNDKENADGVRGHLKAIGNSDYKAGIYEKCVKRVVDMILSGVGLIVLAPIYLIVIIAIKADDPGPAFFTQKRVGKNKKYFKLHKFRSMKMSTPHDRPTHMLDNPEQHIAKVGKFIRVHSLDERVIIGQTTESLENRGFRKVSPIHFHGVMTYFSMMRNM